MPTRYEETSDILAIHTCRVDKYGRVCGLSKYRGRSVRILILLKHPELSLLPDVRRPL